MIDEFEPVENVALETIDEARRMIYNRDVEKADLFMVKANEARHTLSALRDRQMIRMQSEEGNLRIEILYLNTLQETQELISTVRHLLRASRHFFAV